LAGSWGEEDQEQEQEQDAIFRDGLLIGPAALRPAVDPARSPLFG
jgi:hypothetical protein